MHEILPARPLEKAPAPLRQAPLPALTGLRFLAALTVAVCHFNNMHLFHLPLSLTVANSFLAGGRPAVTLFFILSGFILTYNYHSSWTSKSLSSFYAARFARVYPVLLLCLAISLVTVIVLSITGHQQAYLAPFCLANVPHPYRFLAIAMVSQLLMLTAWTPVLALNQPWTGAAWTLSCEMCFYLLFPWLLGRLRVLPMRVVWGIAVGTYVLQCALLLLIHHIRLDLRLPLHPPIEQTSLFYQFPLTHMAEFVVGVAAALWFLRGGEIRLAGRPGVILLWVSLLLLTVAGAVTYRLIGEHLPLSFVEIPAFAGVILALAAAPRALPFVSRPSFVLLGEASYSLYLIHGPCMRLLELHPLGDWGDLLCLLAIIGVCILIFRFYEEPCRRWIRLAWKRHLASSDAASA